MRKLWLALLVTVTLFGYKPYGSVRYNRFTTVEVTGALMEVRDVAEPADLRGVHFFVRVDNSTVDVYVAPKEYYDSLGISLRTGTALTITGSKVNAGHTDVVLARQIRWDGVNYLTLRDADGRPVWEVPRMT